MAIGYNISKIDYFVKRRRKKIIKKCDTSAHSKLNLEINGNQLDGKERFLIIKNTYITIVTISIF
jgi:hypothetical protein